MAHGLAFSSLAALAALAPRMLDASHFSSLAALAPRNAIKSESRDCAREVRVPQKKPTPNGQYHKKSSFNQSEYLVPESAF